MALNITLKVAILTSGLTQTDVSQRTKIHESRLSRIIRGHADPTDHEKRLIARALRVSPSDLFVQRDAVA